MAWRMSHRIPQRLTINAPSAASELGPPPGTSLGPPSGFRAAPVKSQVLNPAASESSPLSSREDGEVVRRGLAAYETGRNATAIKEFERVVRNNPRLPIA